jgi:hypothetical protein
MHLLGGLHAWAHLCGARTVPPVQGPHSSVGLSCSPILHQCPSSIQDPALALQLRRAGERNLPPDTTTSTIVPESSILGAR